MAARKTKDEGPSRNTPYENKPLSEVMCYKCNKRDTLPGTALARFTVYEKTQIQTMLMCSVDRKKRRRLIWS